MDAATVPHVLSCKPQRLQWEIVFLVSYPATERFGLDVALDATARFEHVESFELAVRLYCFHPRMVCSSCESERLLYCLPTPDTRCYTRPPRSCVFPALQDAIDDCL